MEEAAASFNGVISLRTREEVVALIEAVARVVTIGNVFENLKQNPQSWRPLLQDIIIIHKSAASFLELCLDPEGKARVQELVDKMEASKRSLGQNFLSLDGNRFPSPQEQQEITTELQNILFSMAEVTDVMEEDQVYRIRRASKLAFQHVLILRETTNDYRLDPKLEDMKFAVHNLLQCLDNRLQVLPDSPLAQDLGCARSDISSNLDPYIDNTKLYLAHGTAETKQIQEKSLEPLVLGIKTVIDLIGDTLTKGRCSFRHEQILEDLDKLTDAVKFGNASEAAGSARLLVEELNKMKQNMEDEPDNSELNDSCDRLSMMTQRLLSATRDALTTNNEDSAAALASTVDDVKAHIVHVAAVEQKKVGGSDLRMQLLQAAKSMSTNMNDFVSQLNVDP